MKNSQHKKEKFILAKTEVLKKQKELLQSMKWKIKRSRMLKNE